VIDVEIYSFPCLPIVAGVFVAGGESVAGGMTLGGALVENPQPGGRAVYEATLGNTQRGSFDSWLMSAAQNRRVFEVPIYRSRQLIAAADLGLIEQGQLWDNDQPWDNGQPWAFDPVAEAAAAALEGAASLDIDMSPYGEVLQVGHVFGVGRRAYIAMDVSYDAGVATVTVAPPLRESVAAGDLVRFRPVMLGTVANAREIVAQYRNRRTLSGRPITFEEVFV
jgi:hypothetical protein